MRLLSYILGLCVVAYLIAAYTLYSMQDRLLLPATPFAEDLRKVPHQSESVGIWNANGHYAGYVVTPSDRQPRGTVIVYHGNEESAETKMPLAEIFVRVGYRVVIVEYPGHGNRQGKRTMSAAVAASREAFAETFARWPAPIYLVGESLGAGMVSQVVTGNESKIAGVALITPWDTLAAVAAERYPILPVSWMLHNDFDSIAALSHYHGPLIVVGAQQDTLIPVAHARHLASAHDPTDLMILTSANHDNWFDAMTPQTWQKMLAWLHAD